MKSPELLKEILRQSHRVASRISPTGELLTTRETFLGDVGRLIALEFTLAEVGEFTGNELIDATTKARDALQKFMDV